MALLTLTLFEHRFFVAGAADSGPVLHDEAVEARLQLLLHRQERLPE